MAESFVKNGKLTTIDTSGNQINHTTTKLIRKVTKKNRDNKKVTFVDVMCSHTPADSGSNSSETGNY